MENKPTSVDMSNIFPVNPPPPPVNMIEFMTRWLNKHKDNISIIGLEAAIKCEEGAIQNTVWGQGKLPYRCAVDLRNFVRGLYLLDDDGAGWQIKDVLDGKPYVVGKNP